jgi:hypothetical protein
MTLLENKVFLRAHQTVHYLLVDKLDLLKKMFNMHPMEMELVKHLVNNKMHMLINKLPIHMEALLKVNNMLVNNLLSSIYYSKYDSILAEQQQQQQHQGYEQQGQQGNGFVQNVQYQNIPQYGVSS